MYRYAIALRYIRTRRITYLSILGVAVGVAALIIVMAVMEGFQEDFKDRIRGVLSDIIVRYRGEKPIEEVERIILSAEHVTAAAPRLRGMALVIGRGGRGAVEIIGIDADREIRVSKLAEYVINSRTTTKAKEASLAIEILEVHFALRAGEMSRSGMLLGKPGGILRDMHAGLRGVKGRLSKESSPAKMADQLGEAEQAFRDALSGLKADTAAPEARGCADSLSDAVTAFFKARRSELETTMKESGELMEAYLAGRGFSLPFADKAAGREVILGEELLQSLHVVTGETVRLYTSGSKSLSSIEDEEDLAKCEFAVAGTFRSKMYKNDSKLVYMPLRTAQALQAREGMVSEYGVKVDDFRNAPEVKEALRSLLPGADVQTWADKRRTLIAAIDLEKAFLSVVLFMIIVVAGFNMLATFAMMVTEKTMDLGILKSLGGSTLGIASIFFLCGVIIAATGSALGAGAGLLFVANINEIEAFVQSATGITPFPREVYYLDSIPTIVNPSDVFWILFPTVSVSVLLGSVFPALKAAMLSPQHALKYE